MSAINRVKLHTRKALVRKLTRAFILRRSKQVTLCDLSGKMAHVHFWGLMSLSRAKPFSQSACRDLAIFASLIIDELITKSGHEPRIPRIHRDATLKSLITLASRNQIRLPLADQVGSLLLTGPSAWLTWWLTSC